MGSLENLIAARRGWSRVLLAGLVAMVLSLASGAWEPAGAQEVQAEKLESLLATVEDEVRRKVLIDQLKALIAARRAAAPAPQVDSLGGRLIATVSERTREIGEQVFSVARALSDFPVLLNWLRRQATDAETRGFWLGLLFKLAAVFAVGVAAEHLAVALLRRVRQGVEDRAGGVLLTRMAFLLGRTVVDLVPVAVFVGAGGLADDHDLGVRTAIGKHQICGGVAQGAAIEIRQGFGQGSQIGGRCCQFPGAFCHAVGGRQVRGGCRWRWDWGLGRGLGGRKGRCGVVHRGRGPVPIDGHFADGFIRASLHIGIYFLHRVFDHQVNIFEKFRLQSLDEGWSHGHHRCKATIHDIYVNQLNIGLFEDRQLRFQGKQVGRQYPHTYSWGKLAKKL